MIQNGGLVECTPSVSTFLEYLIPKVWFGLGLVL